MSSVANITVPTLDAGADFVSASALDAQLAKIVDTINRLIVAIGQVRDATNDLADGVALWYQFTARAKQWLSDIVDLLIGLYGHLPRWTEFPVPDGGPYATADSIEFTGYVTTPVQTRWAITVPGVAGAQYTIRMRVRHYAPPSPAATVRVTVSGSLSRTWLFNSALTMVPGDAVIQMTVTGGDLIAILYDSGDSIFTAKVDLPDLHPRFPYRARYRAAGAVQFDWLSMSPKLRTTSYRLLEDGSYRLLEISGRRLLE